MAAVAAARGERVAVLKPAQTGVAPGEPGDLAVVTRLTDSRDALTSALAAASTDVVVVSGSSSRGPADHLRPVLADLDAEIAHCGAETFGGVGVSVPVAH